MGKVIKADVDNQEWMDIICAPLTDFGEVFEQFISVEELTTENGKTRSRVAGLIKEKQHERKCDYTLRFYKSAN